MTLPERVRRLTPEAVTDWFAVGNLGFLAVDIGLAHEANNFAAKAEWIPIFYSAVAPVLLAVALLLRGPAWLTRALATLVGVSSIAVGVLGMVFHLQSGFFEEQSLHQLVYTAPFIAPLSYVGLGLLVLLDRLERTGTLAWAQWVVLLALGGFVGNLGLTLLDHAQNGFFSPAEWTGVFAAAFAVTFLGTVMFRPSSRFVQVCFAVMGVQVLVGLLGAILHIRADVGSRATSWHDRLVFGAPIFAPLLFADLALLAGLGLWALWRLRPLPGDTAA